jgi:hypothetical protein
VFTARDAVIGATPAIRATSCKVTAPLPRRVRRGVSFAGVPLALVMAEF